MALIKHEELIQSAPISTNEDSDFSIPLCIDDIINICQDFSKLGYSAQAQIDAILIMGVEEAISSGKVKQEYLPHIKFFFGRIIDNPYFGEASDQASDCLRSIEEFEEKHKIGQANLN